MNVGVAGIYLRETVGCRFEKGTNCFPVFLLLLLFIQLSLHIVVILAGSRHCLLFLLFIRESLLIAAESTQFNAVRFRESAVTTEFKQRFSHGREIRVIYINVAPWSRHLRPCSLALFPVAVPLHPRPERHLDRLFLQDPLFQSALLLHVILARTRIFPLRSVCIRGRDLVKPLVAALSGRQEWTRGFRGNQSGSLGKRPSMMRLFLFLRVVFIVSARSGRFLFGRFHVFAVGHLGYEHGTVSLGVEVLLFGQGRLQLVLARPRVLLARHVVVPGDVGFEHPPRDLARYEIRPLHLLLHRFLLRVVTSRTHCVLSYATVRILCHFLCRDRRRTSLRFHCVILVLVLVVV